MRPMNSADGAMKTYLRSFARDESGATAIEYGLIAALLSVAIITGVGAVGLKVKTVLFDSIVAALG